MPAVPPTPAPLELRRETTERTLAASLPGFSVVGLGGALAAPGAVLRAAAVRAPAVSHGYRWPFLDQWTRTWWPQGIAVGEHNRTPLALVSWYAKPRRGIEQGARVSIIDLSDPRRPTYRHVLLVEPRDTDTGVVFDPVLAHAGGIAWSGDRLLVAATFDGIREFRLSDILQSKAGLSGPLGYPLVLPQFAHHRAAVPKAADRMRYSFLTVETPASAAVAADADAPLDLVAGEYNRDSGRRLARLTLGGERSDVHQTHQPHIAKMQGVALHGGEWFVSASDGTRPGHLWVGGIDEMRDLGAVLPPGPESLAVWPAHNELWSVSEIPGKRSVYVMDIAQLT